MEGSRKEHLPTGPMRSRGATQTHLSVSCWYLASKSPQCANLTSIIEDHEARGKCILSLHGQALHNVTPLPSSTPGDLLIQDRLCFPG